MQENRLVQIITEEVMRQLNIQNADKELRIPVGVSVRHIHLCEKVLARLFGENYELVKQKDLQPGEFASTATVTLVGPKMRALEKVRVMGPLRSYTQVEISRTDAIYLGVEPPVRVSGDIEDSASLTVVGPEGSVKLNGGVIIAQRHIHMPPDIARQYGLSDKQTVSLSVDGFRALDFHNVLVRVIANSALELHIDSDEANAAGLLNKSAVKLLLKR